jgi:hypothetical protein
MINSSCWQSYYSALLSFLPPRCHYHTHYLQARGLCEAVAFGCGKYHCADSMEINNMKHEFEIRSAAQHRTE